MVISLIGNVNVQLLRYCEKLLRNFHPKFVKSRSSHTASVLVKTGAAVNRLIALFRGEDKAQPRCFQLVWHYQLTLLLSHKPVCHLSRYSSSRSFFLSFFLCVVAGRLRRQRPKSFSHTGRFSQRKVSLTCAPPPHLHFRFDYTFLSTLRTRINQFEYLCSSIKNISCTVKWFVFVGPITSVEMGNVESMVPPFTTDHVLQHACTPVKQ